MTLLECRFALFVKARRDSGCIVARRPGVYAGCFGKKRSAECLHFERRAELGTKFGPVTLTRVQKAVRYAEPRLILAELRADHHEIEVELRIVLVVQRI